MAEKTVLVTGGAGYIGSHTVVQLLGEGFEVTIIDNFDNSVEEAINRVREVAGPGLSKNLHFHYGDLRKLEDCEKLFSQTKFDGVIHFAGFKAVGESVQCPLRYFENNLIGSINLYKTMEKYSCKKRKFGFLWKSPSPFQLDGKLTTSDLEPFPFRTTLSNYWASVSDTEQNVWLVFSSSCTVYGDPEKVPCVEDMRLCAVSPYGRTKLVLEDIARDIQKADPEWKIIQLRYFNPIGAHESGRLGDNPRGIPNCLMPYLTQVAVGRLPELNVFGTDYPTPDGTAIRDYIHIIDLADGHIAALRKLFEKGYTGCTEYNLGTGHGTSVLQLVHAFEEACGKKIPLKMCPRRAGDAYAVYGNTDKAEKELGWKAKRGIEQMCVDQWNWAVQNPMGYE